jgi:predicted metalloprotease
MKWGSARRSSKIQDRRGQGPMRGVGGFGFGGIAVIVAASLLLGQNPLEMLGLLSQMQGGPSTRQGSSDVSADDEDAQFVAAILGETEDVWGEIFAARGARYTEPTLVLFSGAVQSACGSATSATGPFYCPGDHQVYIDLDFFAQMRQSLGGGGDFAQAYVIAHEVGHHVQTLLGTTARVDQARQRGERIEGDGGLLVRQELQADCYAGLWANRAQRRHDWLEAGDLDEALNTASAIGDDTLQRRSRGTVVPDSFSHGSAAERVRWFRAGFHSDDLASCDTFAARQL